MTPGIRETKEYGRWHLMRRKSPFRSLFLSLAGWGSATRPQRAWKSHDFGLADQNSSNSAKLTALVSAKLRQRRSGQGSSPCSRQLRSPSQTPPSRRHMHRLPRAPAAASSNRTLDRRVWRST
jgi:hypothetical protein